MFNGIAARLAQTLEPFMGQKIVAADLDPSANDGNGELLLTFVGGQQLAIYDYGQMCCEHRHLHTSDDLSQYVGETLTDFYQRSYSRTDDDSSGEVTEIAFLVVQTDRGHFVLETHNVHNGYYNGFSLDAEVRHPEQG